MEGQQRPPATRFLPARKSLLIGLVAATVLAGVMPFIKDSPGETTVYALAAQRLVRGEEFYRPDEGRAFTYPPFFALPYAPLAALPEQVARSTWYFLNFALLGTIVGVVVCIVRPVITSRTSGGGPPTWAAALLIGLLSARFVISPIEYQSHDLILFALALATVAFWETRRGGLAGIAAGLATACKATPLLFLPVFLLQRRFVASAAMVATIVGATVLPDLVFPRNDGGLWVLSWHRHFVSKVEVGAAADAEGAWSSWNLLNQSLSGTLHRIFTPVAVDTEAVFDVSLGALTSRQLEIVTMFTQLAVVCFIAFAVLPGRTRNLVGPERRFQRLGEAGAVLCGMLLLSPMSSKQHFCVLLVPIAFCAVDFLYRRRSKMVTAMLLLVFTLGTLGVKDLVGKAFGDRLLAYGSLTVCTLACLVATGAVLVDRSRTAAADNVDDWSAVRFSANGAGASMPKSEAA